MILNIANDYGRTTAYGGIAEIPTGLDILIAGFACVDFSPLNTRPKDLKDGGESADTFFAVLEYCKQKRPRLVILENVKNAPWCATSSASVRQSLHWHFEKIGYAALHILVNTADYYLPQTRNRGYLLAIDKRGAPNHEMQNCMLKQWTHLMEKSARPASSRSIEFLQEIDMQDLPDPDSKSRKDEIDWPKCEVQHGKYRQDLGLGSRHILTNWKAGGGSKLPDYFYVPSKPYTERVNDSIDIAHLRNIKRGLDDRYYRLVLFSRREILYAHDGSRILELSQSVFRVVDGNADGMTGCITPTGMPFSTIHGRMLTAKEGLTLQGMPLGFLHFLEELSEKQLRDMAGNAMTTTLVTIAECLALIVGLPLLPRGIGDEMPQSDSIKRSPLSTRSRNIATPAEHAPDIEKGRFLSPSTNICAIHITVSMSAFKHMANASRQLCACEGQNHVYERTFYKCQICSHTVCDHCAGQPKHVYSTLDMSSSGRVLPDVLRRYVGGKFPVRIRIHQIFKGISTYLVQSIKIYRGMLASSSAKSRQRTTCYRCLVLYSGALLAAKEDMYLGQGLRSDRSIVIYESEHARLLLSNKPAELEWQLYIKAPATLPAISNGRFVEDFAIARMRPTVQSDNIFEGTWDIWVPQKTTIPVLVTPTGLSEPTYASAIGLAGRQEERQSHILKLAYVNPQHAKLLDEDVHGEYQSAPLCGQPFNTLHVSKQRQGHDAPLAIYFHHPHAGGDFSTHRFIISQHLGRTHWSESVPIVAAFPKGWRPPSASDGDERQRKSCSLKVHGFWQHVGITKDSSFTPLEIRADTLSNTTLEPQSFRCDSFLTVLHCSARNIHVPTKDIPSSAIWQELSKSDFVSILPKLYWLLSASSFLDYNHHGPTGWTLSSTAYHSPARCPCAPKIPHLAWRCQALSEKPDSGYELRPIEDAQELTSFEKASRHAGSAFCVEYHAHEDCIGVRISARPISLIHRALQCLHRRPCHDRFLGALICSAAQTDWQITTDNPSCSSIKSNTITFGSYKQQYDLPEFPAGCTLELKALQRQPVAWMLHMEQEPTPFTEEEIIEERLPGINYRLWGRARQDVLVRGGVLAQDVGFGKTILVIATILASLDSDTEVAEKPVYGHFTSRATIIYTPPHLIGQWVSEVLRFCPGWAHGVEVIGLRTVHEHQRLTLWQIRNARILVVSWELHSSAKYEENLAQFAGVLQLAKKQNRSTAAWYDLAAGGVEDMVEYLCTHGTAHFIAQKQRKSQAAWLSSQLQPCLKARSSRSRGQAYMDSKSSQRNDVPSSEKLSKEHVSASATPRAAEKGPTRPQNTRHWQTSVLIPKRSESQKRKCSLDLLKLRGVPLEAFRFSRAVVDEFNYPDQRLAGQLSRLIQKAHCRWVLSATPKLDTFEDVKRIAGLIGINIGRTNYSVNRAGAVKELSGNVPLHVENLADFDSERRIPHL